MYTDVILKDGREGVVVSRQFDKTISDEAYYDVEIFPPPENGEGWVIGAYEKDFETVGKWEEVEEEEITEY